MLTLEELDDGAISDEGYEDLSPEDYGTPSLHIAVSFAFSRSQQKSS